MKCWECRKETDTGYIVRYLAPVGDCEYKEKLRCVCGECYGQLKLNLCHYVEVDKINQKVLDKKWYE